MELEHPELALFEPTLRRLTDLAFNKGIEAIESVGLSISDVTENPSALRRFIRGCHYGYDLAQRQIGSLMIEIVEGRSELSRKLKRREDKEMEKTRKLSG